VATLDRLTVKISRKSYPALDGGGETDVLRDIELDAGGGEFVAVIGPSGCGKTTLLNIVAGLDDDFDGAVSLPRRGGQEDPVIGCVFQNPRLLPWRTVSQNIRLVLGDHDDAADRVCELLRLVGLADQGNVFPSRLSVGMGRRAALARAFAIDPDMLLMDEPFVSLDPQAARGLRVLLLDIWAKRPTTVLFVTHDLREAIMLADRIVVLPREAGPAAAEIPVSIPRDRRADEAAIETFRETILRDYRDAFGEIA
jgi:NitT/TauT family transport system ATP-binding protein